MKLSVGDEFTSSLSSELEASSNDVSEVLIDVTGQGRVSAENSIAMLEPRLENINAVAVLDPEYAEVDDRTDIVERSSGERPVEFYRDYFEDSSGVVVSSLEPEGLDKCVEELKYIEQALRNEAGFSHGQTRFGLGIENNFVKATNVSEAVAELDEKLGFQVIFSYTDDEEASEKFQQYMENNQLFKGTVEEGVTGIVSVGRSHFPQVYMAGPRDLEVDMPEFPGYTDNLETRHVYDLV